MAAGITRIHGQAAAGAFYGLQPLVLKVGKSNVMTADTVVSGGGNSGDTLVTEGGYSKAVRAIQTVASIVWLGAVDGGEDFVTAIIDAGTFNDGPGATTAGQYGALKDALGAQFGNAGSGYSVATYATLTGTATFSA